MIVTIQEHGKTSAGTPKVKANNEWYFLARNIGDPPSVGATVEIREGSFRFKDGKQAKTIEAWKPSGAAPVASVPAPSSYGESELRFISNVVGSAIVGGICKEPGQVLAWFSAARSALEGKPAEIPFSDEIPNKDW